MDFWIVIVCTNRRVQLGPVRRVCHAKKPACGACPLAPMCPSYGLGPTSREAAIKLLKGPRVDEIAEMTA